MNQFQAKMKEGKKLLMSTHGQNEMMSLLRSRVVKLLNLGTCTQGEFMHNRPFSYSEKEFQSNDTLLHFVEFSNVHNSDRSSNAT